MEKWHVLVMLGADVLLLFWASWLTWLPPSVVGQAKNRRFNRYGFWIGFGVVLLMIAEYFMAPEHFKDIFWYGLIR